MTTPTNDIYIPAHAQSLKDCTIQRHVFGIIGEGGSGKSYSCMTFPNPIVADFDNKLGQHYGKDIPRIPFWDPNFTIGKLGCRGKVYKDRPSVRDAVIKWLTTEGPKLSPKQTLIYDSWSSFQTFMDIQHRDEPTFGKSGEVNKMEYFGRKLDFSETVLSLVLALPCNVVMTFHELDEWEDDRPTGRIKPLMQGSFCQKIPTMFPNFIRQVRRRKTKIDEATKKPVETNEEEFLWQINADKKFPNAITDRKFKDNPLYIPASFQAWVEYPLP